MRDRIASLLPYLLPQLRDVLFISIFISVVAYGPRLFHLDGDLGRHVTIGNYILNNGEIPINDVFSHTMYGEPLVPHEWIAQILFAVSTNLMGLSGSVLLTALIIGLTFLIVYRDIVRRGAPTLIAVFVLIWTAAASSIHWLARPHIFTLVFIAIWTCLLEQERNGNKRSIIVFPALMLIWANTHGAFIAGFVVWGAYAAEWFFSYLQKSPEKELGTRLGMIGISSFAVTFINPSGYRLWTTSLGYIQNSYLTSHTQEYMPPNFQNPAMLPFAIMLIYGLFSLGGNRRLPWRHALLLAGWAFVSLFSMRNIPLFAILSAPIYARLLHEQTENFRWLNKLNELLANVESRLKGATWSLMTVAIVGIALFKGIPLDVHRQGNNFDPRVFPVEAVNWLESNPQQGNMFNHFPWGGYLLYETWSQNLVFIDGQTDFYGEALTREYETVIFLGDGWETILEKYEVNWAIIEEDSILADRLLREENWELLYRDETAVILRK